jgi:hypothetical protein
MRERRGGSGVLFTSSVKSYFLQTIPEIGTGSMPHTKSVPISWFGCRPELARHVGLDKNDLLMEARLWTATLPLVSMGVSRTRKGNHSQENRRGPALKEDLRGGGTKTL